VRQSGDVAACRRLILLCTLAGTLDEGRMYEMLKVMLSADLTDEQLAQLVTVAYGCSPAISFLSFHE